MYVCYKNQIYYTDDFGKSWVDISLSARGRLTGIFYNGSSTFAITDQRAGLLKLSDDFNWNYSNSGLPDNREITNLSYCNDVLYAYSDYRGLYKNSDGGSSWTNANIKQTKGLYVTYLKQIGQYFFSSNDAGIFFTDDLNNEWYPLNDGLFNKKTPLIQVINDTIYIGTKGNGIFKRSINEAILSSSKNKNSDYSILIYPNPAEGYIRIKSVENDLDIIRLFDLSGKEVLTKRIFDEDLVDISYLPSGLYIVHIYSNNKTFTTKISIQK